MLAGHHHTNEFIFDSDEGSPLPNRPASPGLDCGQVMNGTPEDYGSPSEALGLTSNTSSPHDSMFDSESSKRTSSTASTKYTFGDMSMDDNGSNNMKLDWNLTDDDFAAMMQPSFNMQASSSAPAQQDVRSPTDSPSPFTFSPDATNMQDAATISKASPQSDAGLSFQTACEDGVGVSESLYMLQSCSPACSMLTTPAGIYLSVAWTKHAVGCLDCSRRIILLSSSFVPASLPVNTVPS